MTQITAQIILEWVIIVLLPVLLIWLTIRRLNYMKQRGLGRDDDKLF